MEIWGKNSTFSPVKTGPKGINNERAIESREQRRERYAPKINGPEGRRLDLIEMKHGSGAVRTI